MATCERSKQKKFGGGANYLPVYINNVIIIVVLLIIIIIIRKVF